MTVSKHDMRLMGVASLGVLAARSWLTRLMVTRTRRQVEALNRGDWEPLLSNYAEDAVLRFHDGRHRWAGTHRGRRAIRHFLEKFVAAGLQGEIVDLWLRGTLRRMTVIVRFDDHARGPSGEVLYENRTVLLMHMRWGRVVYQEDFYEDTEKIERLDRSLREMEGRAQQSG